MPCIEQRGNNNHLPELIMFSISLMARVFDYTKKKKKKIISVLKIQISYQ
jgi:hypothetical protein